MSASLDAVTAAVITYGDQRAADQQATDQAACDARAAELQAQLAAAETAHQAELDQLRAETAPQLAELAELRAGYALYRANHEPARFGVNIHSPFRYTVYGNHAALYDAIVASGASWVRDNLAPGQADAQLALWARLRAAGIGVQVVVSSLGSDLDGDTLATALHNAAPYLIGVEGFNEPDKDADWLQPTVDHQLWLAGVVAADPALSHVRILGPAIKARSATFEQDNAEVYARTAGAYTHGNLHCYPAGGKGAAWYLDTWLPAFPEGVPVVVSEGGYNTGLGIPDHGTPVDEATQAELTADYLVQCSVRGLDLCLYELLDDPDPDNAEWESHFGVFRCPSLDPSTWSPKPLAGVLYAAAHRV